MFQKLKEVYINATSRFNHFYFIPLFGLICWYTLCFGLMGIWLAKGAKPYPKYGETEVPLPLERIGMILQPGFFISFIVIHSVVFCSSMYLEYYHRKIGKLIKFIKPEQQRRLAYASLIVGGIAQLFFIAQAISGTVYVRAGLRASTHYAVLLATFAILVMISLGLNFTNYYIMGQYYRKYVNGERWNKFTISFVLKIIWLFVTLTVAIICCVFYVKKKKNVSSVLEWIFHFWYGLLLAFWTYDLYPLTELRALRNKSASTEKHSIKEKVSSFFGSKKMSKNDDVDSNTEKSTTAVTINATDSSISGEDDQSVGGLESPVGFNYTTRYDYI